MLKALRKFSRQFHLWAALSVALPVVIVIISGLLLQVKKEIDWIQPPTIKGINQSPELSFDAILTRVKQVPEAQITDWNDINKLDVRPKKGVIKVQAHNHWEIQLDSVSGEVLQVAFRRSNTIEAIHDGSWFFDKAKLVIFLPSAIVLMLIWLSGLVLLYTTLKSKWKKRRHQRLSR